MQSESPSKSASASTIDALAAATKARSGLRAPQTRWQWFGSAVLPRAFRLTLLVAVAAILYFAGQQPPRADNVSLDAARRFFPTAAKLAAGDARLGGQAVLDDKGQALGLLLTTSPHTDDLIGYSGPSNLLIALDLQLQIIGVQVLSSGDTPNHVDQIRADRPFWQQFAGTDQNTKREKIDGVSGSTLTSLTFAEGIERRLRGSSVSLRFPEEVKLREIRKLFKAARKFEANNPRTGWNKALDADGKLLGYVVRTSPYSDNARGYQGPTESLVAIGADGKTVVDVLIRKSYDTELYVERVRPSDEFRESLTGRTIDDWAKIDFAQEGIEGVSGATQTSFAIADGMRRRFTADTAVLTPPQKPWNWQPGLLVVIGVGCAFAFSSLKVNRRVRLVWQGILIVAFVFWLGDLLSLALLVGWSRHGLPWQTGPAVILLAAVALVAPWISRRQVYCQQICPHGAAQLWLAQFKQFQVPISATWHRWLSFGPAVLLTACFLLAVFAVRFDLAQLEAFDGWVLKGAAVVSFLLAVGGLIVSLFVPLAYCRYGCPTGELLQLVKSGGPHDRLQRRDWLAAGLVALVAAFAFGPKLSANSQPANTNSPITEPKFVELGGKAFGTTWTVKIRGDHQIAPLQEAVAAELARIESSLSHWRPDSSTAQFNASETTLETEQPDELLKLVARSLEISKLTGGRYDITVAPLVDAWGYGPTGERAPPGDAELAELRERIGYEKLLVDREAKTLRKKHPQLRLDLGSLLQGYAADQVKVVLDQAGVQEFLIDIGGELLTRGSWKVGIEDPRDPRQLLRSFTLQNAALATSGLYRGQKNVSGQSVHHLISPQSGRPIATTTILCAVSAPTAVEADAWATALLAVGMQEGLPLADQQGFAVLYWDQTQSAISNPAGDKLFGVAPAK